MRRSLMNTRRTGSPNCRITLLPGTRRRSSRSVEDQLLDRGRVPGSNNTMWLRGRGDLFPLTVGCQNPWHPTQNGRPKFRFPLNQHTFSQAVNSFLSRRPHASKRRLRSSKTSHRLSALPTASSWLLPITTTQRTFSDLTNSLKMQDIAGSNPRLNGRRLRNPKKPPYNSKYREL